MSNRGEIKYRDSDVSSFSGNIIPCIREHVRKYIIKQETYKKPKFVGKIEEEGGEVYWQPQM